MKRRLARLAALFALVVSLLAVGEPARTLPDTSPTCDLAARVAERLAELGEVGKSTWSVDHEPNPNYFGYVPAPNVVQLSPEIPCEKIDSVVNHEWMHLLQERTYPGRAQRAYGEHETYELVADCGSKLLGSSFTPYEVRVRECSASEFDSASWLLEKAGASHLIHA